MVPSSVPPVLNQLRYDLANLCDDVLQRIPQDRKWNDARIFLANAAHCLRSGDMKAGRQAFYKVLPYIQSTVANLNESSKLFSASEVTATLSRHLLVSENERKELEELLGSIRLKVDLLRDKVNSFANKLDRLLEGILEKGQSVGFITMMKFGFDMNRISSLIYTCEDQLFKARVMLKALNHDVMGKYVLAYAVFFISVIVGAVASVTGNLSFGAGCFTVAGVSRKLAKNLGNYKEKLNIADAEHRKLQSDFEEWRSRFYAERWNFLLLIGYE